MTKARRVLIVDDEAALREILQVGLEAYGFDVVTAGDGEEALKLAGELRPDLVLLDLQLPKLNGFQVCRRLKGDARLSAIPVIMLTARRDPGAEYWSGETGATEYMTKPFELQRVVSRVRDLLGALALPAR